MRGLQDTSRSSASPAAAKEAREDLWTRAAGVAWDASQTEADAKVETLRRALLGEPEAPFAGLLASVAMPDTGRVPELRRTRRSAPTVPVACL